MSTERNVKVACDSLLLAAVLWAGSAAAQSSESFGLEQLMAQLAHVERAEAQFVEQKYMKVLKTPLESSGTLIYEAPDRMIKRTDKPKPETMIVEGGPHQLRREPEVMASVLEWLDRKLPR